MKEWTPEPKTLEQLATQLDHNFFEEFYSEFSALLQQLLDSTDRNSINQVHYEAYRLLLQNCTIFELHDICAGTIKNLVLTLQQNNHIFLESDITLLMQKFYVPQESRPRFLSSTLWSNNEKIVLLLDVLICDIFNHIDRAQLIRTSVCDIPEEHVTDYELLFQLWTVYRAKYIPKEILSTLLFEKLSHTFFRDCAQWLYFPKRYEQSSHLPLILLNNQSINHSTAWIVLRYPAFTDPLFVFPIFLRSNNLTALNSFFLRSIQNGISENSFFSILKLFPNEINRYTLPMFRKPIDQIQELMLQFKDNTNALIDTLSCPHDLSSAPNFLRPFVKAYNKKQFNLAADFFRTQSQATLQEIEKHVHPSLFLDLLEHKDVQEFILKLIENKTLCRVHNNWHKPAEIKKEKPSLVVLVYCIKYSPIKLRLLLENPELLSNILYLNMLLAFSDYSMMLMLSDTMKFLMQNAHKDSYSTLLPPFKDIPQVFMDIEGIRVKDSHAYINASEFSWYLFGFRLNEINHTSNDYHHTCNGLFKEGNHYQQNRDTVLQILIHSPEIAKNLTFGKIQKLARLYNSALKYSPNIHRYLFVNESEQRAALKTIDILFSDELLINFYHLNQFIFVKKRISSFNYTEFVNTLYIKEEKLFGTILQHTDFHESYFVNFLLRKIAFKYFLKIANQACRFDETQQSVSFLLLLSSHFSYKEAVSLFLAHFTTPSDFDHYIQSNQRFFALLCKDPARLKLLRDLSSIENFDSILGDDLSEYLWLIEGNILLNSMIIDQARSTKQSKMIIEGLNQRFLINSNISGYQALAKCFYHNQNWKFSRPISFAEILKIEDEYLFTQTLIDLTSPHEVSILVPAKQPLIRPITQAEMAPVKYQSSYSETHSSENHSDDDENAENGDEFLSQNKRKREEEEELGDERNLSILHNTRNNPDSKEQVELHDDEIKPKLDLEPNPHPFNGLTAWTPQLFHTQDITPDNLPPEYQRDIFLIDFDPEVEIDHFDIPGNMSDNPFK